MPSLAAIIFLVVLLTQLVSWIGKSVLQELAYTLYSRLFLSGTSKRQRSLRQKILEDKAELSKTSSQDEFAKWAKLKRKVDKGLADLETINATLGSARTSFTLRFSSLLWILTTGAQLVLVWWYRRQPVFWLPKGWVPGPVGWVLSLPSAPKGAVSSGAWCTVCKRVLVTAEELVKDIVIPRPPSPVPPFPASSQLQPASQVPSAKIEPLEHDHLD